jgi:hypothetical protein
MRLMPKSTNAAKVIELILCGMSLTFALPMSIALFEQHASLDRELIDEELKELLDEDGNLIQTFYFNKGL